VHGTLAELPDLLDGDRLDGPTLVLIGSVVSLSQIVQEAGRLAA
jgi:siroheme synthase